MNFGKMLKASALIVTVLTKTKIDQMIYKPSKFCSAFFVSSYNLVNHQIMPIFIIMDIKNIMHSKWTAVVVQNKQKHFEVVSYNRKKKSVYLKPSLGGKSRCCLIDDLNQSNLWKPGWL